MSLYDDENEDKAEAIRQDAIDAAINAWGPGGCNHRPCPHPDGSEASDIWWSSFNRQLFKENH